MFSMTTRIRAEENIGQQPESGYNQNTKYNFNHGRLSYSAFKVEVDQLQDTAPVDTKTMAHTAEKEFAQWQISNP